MNSNSYLADLKTIFSQRIVNNLETKDYYPKLVFCNREDNWTDLVASKDIGIVNTVVDFWANNFVLNDLISNLKKSNRINYNNSATILFLYSYMCSKDYNLLLCKQDEIYFLVGQQVTTVDWIVFPQFNLCINFCHAVAIEIKYLLKDLYLHLCSLSDFDLYQQNRNWGGIIISQIRPFHYMYDVMPAFHYIVDENLIGLVPAFYEISDRDFLDIARFYGLNKSNFNKGCDSDIRSWCEKRNVFLLKIGFDSSKNDYRKHIEYFDDFLLNNHYKLGTNTQDQEIELIKKTKNDFVLWLGVDSEKRKWLELKEAVDLVIGFLLKLYEKVYICIDGLTNTLSGSMHFSNENYNKILDIFKCNDRVVLLNMANKELMYKITFINSWVDWHISNGMTPSMCPARFSRVPGVMYSSQGTYDFSISNHKKYNGTMIGRKVVRDMAAQTNTVFDDHVSYSIDPIKFLDFFKKYFFIIEKGCQIVVTAMNNIHQIDSKKFISTSDDPQIILSTPLFLQNNYESLLTTFYFDIHINEKLKDSFIQIFFDYGNGFSEKDSYVINIYNNTFFDILIKRPVKRLRLDPINNKGEFYLYGLYCIETHKMLD